MRDVFEPTLTKKKIHLEETIAQKLEIGIKHCDIVELMKQNELYSKYGCKTRRFLKFYSPDNWILNEDNDTEMTSINFKPVDISKYSQELLFKYGRKVLFMSATIINKKRFCEINGLDIDKTAFLSIPSPFSPKNKPIYYCPAGNMGLTQISETLPKIDKIIKKILKRHKNDKGIIHCHSYKITDFIKKNIRDRRLLSHHSKNRDKILKKHTISKKPTVILSPSMEEGVDLKDNISRFQIICKIPYPFLGDKLVQSRMKKWNWWYSFETTKKIVQSLGRSIRSKKDYASTYILDTWWDTFYNNNMNLFPKNFEKHFVNQ